MTSESRANSGPRTALWVVTDSDEPRRLAPAIAVMAGAERDIDLLWRDSVAGGDEDLSERLADLSHALQRATIILRHLPDAIG